MSDQQSFWKHMGEFNYRPWWYSPNDNFCLFFYAPFRQYVLRDRRDLPEFEGTSMSSERRYIHSFATDMLTSEMLRVAEVVAKLR